MKKLKLKDLKVESYVTSLDEEKAKQVAGGSDSAIESCGWTSCWSATLCSDTCSACSTSDQYCGAQIQ